MNHWYILDESGEPQSTDNPILWANWWMKANRKIAETQILDVCISTVFLGINHNWRPNGPPVLWETMIFAPPVLKEINYRQWRYTSKQQALDGHEQAVEWVRSIIGS